MDHRRVARDGDLVDLRRVDGGLAARLEGELVHRLVREVLELLEGGRIEHDGADAADDIGAERLLLVQHGCDSRRGAGRQVEEGRDDGRRAEIECDAEEPRGRVARLHRHEAIVDDDSGELPVARARNRGQAAKDGGVIALGEVGDAVEHPVDVGALVGKARVVELEIALDEARPQDHLATDPDGRRLRTRRHWRHVDA